MTTLLVAGLYERDSQLGNDLNQLLSDGFVREGFGDLVSGVAVQVVKPWVGSTAPRSTGLATATPTRSSTS